MALAEPPWQRAASYGASRRAGFPSADAGRPTNPEVSVSATSSRVLKNSWGAVLCCASIAALVATSWLYEFIADASAVVGSSVALTVTGGVGIVAFLACALLHRRIENALAEPTGGVAMAVLLVAGVCAAFGHALANYWPAGVAASWPGWLGLVTYSLCEPVILLITLYACCHDQPTTAPVIYSGAYALAAGIQIAVRYTQQSAAGVVGIALPLLASIAMAFYVRRFARTGEDAEGRASGEDAERTERGAAPASRDAGSGENAGDVTWSFPVRPIVLMMAYSFSFYFSLALSEGPNPFGMFGMLAVSLLTLAFALASHGQYSFTFLYRLALPLMVADLVFLSFLGTGRSFAVMFGNSGNVAFTLFLLITLTWMCHRYGISSTWMFGLVYAASGLAEMIGLPAGEAFVAAYPVGSETSRLVMCCLVVAMVVLSTVLFNDQAVARSFGMVPTSVTAAKDAAGAVGASSSTQLSPDAMMSYSERIVWRSTQMAHRFGLTQREQEVLELLIQGMSVSEMADRASISVGTVKTHVNHIYRKLGVHSREETMALVDRLASR